MPDTYDLVIKNGRIIDGTGDKGYQTDIGIQAGQIISIKENIDGDIANQIIQADSLVVAPGFIDAHSHDDFFPLINPTCEEKVLQGVTTTVIGNCGFSPAPMVEKYAAELRDSLRVLSDLKIDTSYFTSFDSFLNVLEAAKPGINIVPLLGHGTLRISAMGVSKRPATDSEMKDMKNRLSEAMEAGAYGLSTGLSYVPGEYATAEEIVELAKVVAGYGGIYTSHIRSERDGVLEAVKEAIAVGESAKIPIQISHLKVAGTNNWGRSEEIIEIIENAINRGVELTCDVYPYNASNTSLTSLLPPDLFADGYQAFSKRLKGFAFRTEIIQEIEQEGGKQWENKIKGTGFENIIIIGSTKFQDYNGCSISSIANREEKNPYDVIFDIIMEEVNKVGVILFAMAEQDICRIMQTPFTMIGSDGGPKVGQTFFHPRFTGTFPRVLGRYVREEKILNIEEAIYKMTSLPAKTFRLKTKGIIKSGFDADMVIFDPLKIKDRSTFKHPSLKPEGIECVIVNGKIAVKIGKVTGNLAGKILRKK